MSVMMMMVVTKVSGFIQGVILWQDVLLKTSTSSSWSVKQLSSVLSPSPRHLWLLKPSSFPSLLH